MAVTVKACAKTALPDADSMLAVSVIESILTVPTPLRASIVVRFCASAAVAPPVTETKSMTSLAVRFKPSISVAVPVTASSVVVPMLSTPSKVFACTAVNGGWDTNDKPLKSESVTVAEPKAPSVVVILNDTESPATRSRSYVPDWVREPKLSEISVATPFTTIQN